MIIPIFVPHEGCPNNCAFCNQHTISGSVSAPSLKEARDIIELHLSTMCGYADQIAFFGGSFTGIDEGEQNGYLSLAYEYIKKGCIGSIRLSTRPDYIDDKTVKRLISYGVRNIELGAQSMDSEVLSASDRGHSADDVIRASAIINSYGAVLGLQMMTGLPFDSKEKCMNTASLFYKLGAKETRIYPTVVLKGTKLEKMYKSGEYRLQTVEEAVDVSAALYEYFENYGIKVLRVGLPDSAQLFRDHCAGPYHPSLGELVISRVIRNKAERAVKNGCVTVAVNPKWVSKLYGNKRCNIEYFKEKGITVNIIRTEKINGYYIDNGEDAKGEKQQ